MEKQRIKAVCCAASAGGMWGTIGLFVSLAGRHGVHSLELEDEFFQRLGDL